MDNNDPLTDFEFWVIILMLSFILHLSDIWLTEELRNSVIRQYPAEHSIRLDQKAERALYGLTNKERELRCKGDRQCRKMAEALVYEARGESLMGAVAVGHVIMARAKEKKNIAKVVDRKKQFSYTVRQQKKKPSKEDWSRALVASYEIIHGEMENPIGYADHFHTLQVKPYWAKHMTYVATIGNHKFYREER